MKWIDATDLNHWADRRESEELCSFVLRRLIHTLTSERTVFDMPSGDSVAVGGWDGVLELEVGTEHIPTGTSVWEFGTNKDKKGKADSDYQKRTNDPGEINPTEASFVFVTPRKWPRGKKSWIKAKAAESIWKDVRVIDADDLEAMLDQVPAVAIWLAERIGKITGTFQSLDEFWDEWSVVTEPAISTDMVLADREAAAKGILAWAQEQPSAKSIRANTEDEAMGFLAAVALTSPESGGGSILSRSVVVKDEAAFQAVKRSLSPLIVIIGSPEIENAKAAVSNGHHVFTPYGYTRRRGDDLITLPRPTAFAFTQALSKSGLDEVEARALSRRCGGTISSFRRLAGGGANPVWASDDNLSVLITAFLTGSWTARRDGDKTFLERLSGLPYADLEARLAPIAAVKDAPILRVKDYWKINAPLDLLYIIAPHLTDHHLEVFREHVQELLGVRDPALDLPPDQRWAANIYDKALDHSGALRDGVLGTLALLAHHSSDADVHTRISPKDIGKVVVRELLDNADGDQWLSLSGNMDDLAEVAPDAFINAIDASLAREAPTVMSLFMDEGSMGGCRHAGLLWGLEALAWDARYLPRVCLTLAKLAERDPGGNWGNRPDRSLTNILLCWRPHTKATIEERVAVIDGVLEAVSEQGWKLLLSLSPSHHGSTSGTHLPHWLPVSGRDQTPKTRGDVWEATSQILDRLERLVGADGARWCDVLGSSFTALPKDLQERLIQQLECLAKTDELKGDREAVRAQIRQRHYYHTLGDDEPDPKEVESLIRLEELLASDDLLVRHKWLFENSWIDIPGGRRTETELADECRRDALLEISNAMGLQSILNFVDEVGDPYVIADMSVRHLDLDEFDPVVIAHVNNGMSEKFAHFLRAYISCRHRDMGWDWSDVWLDHAFQAGWCTETVLHIFLGLPCGCETWSRMANFGDGPTKQYWKRVSLWNVCRDDPDGCIEAMTRVLDAGRPAHVIHQMDMVGHAADIPSELILKALHDLAMTEEQEEPVSSNLAYHITDLFKVLDERDDVTDESIANLEWPYARMFQHSQRPQMAAHRGMNENPDWFATLISWAFKADRDIDDQEGDHELTEQQKMNRASTSYEILSSWRGVPGRDEDGELNYTTLKGWIEDACNLTRKSGRASVGIRKIGEMLAYAPNDREGGWPHEGVRDVIQDCDSDDLDEGVFYGLRNKRGVIPIPKKADSLIMF